MAFKLSEKRSTVPAADITGPELVGMTQDGDSVVAIAEDLRNYGQAKHVVTWADQTTRDYTSGTIDVSLAPFPDWGWIEVAVGQTILVTNPTNIESAGVWRIDSIVGDDATVTRIEERIYLGSLYYSLNDDILFLCDGATNDDFDTQSPYATIGEALSTVSFKSIGKHIAQQFFYTLPTVTGKFSDGLLGAQSGTTLVDCTSNDVTLTLTSPDVPSPAGGTLATTIVVIRTDSVGGNTLTIAPPSGVAMNGVVDATFTIAPNTVKRIYALSADNGPFVAGFWHD